MSRIREEAEIKLIADTRKAVRAIEEARQILRAAETIRKLRTMHSTALMQNREPVRWRLSRMVVRQLAKSEEARRVGGYGPIRKVFGVPVEIDEDTPVGFGLVVR